MDKQRTIKEKIIIEGIGLHTGEKSKIELLPAEANRGIVFIRQDTPSPCLIHADIFSLPEPEEFPRRTSIGEGGVYVHTIEHIMAAFNFLKIDNIQINIWGEEIPGLDGSAKEFVEKIKEAGIVEQQVPRNYLVIKEPIWVEGKDSCIVILPSSNLRISYILQYDNPLINSSCFDFVLNGEEENNLYEARTFCLEEEVKSLLDEGLGKGANYENTLVVSGNKIIDNELRFPDEFIKHKVLDLMGDLYLAGPIKGYVIAKKTGHLFNIKLLHKLKKYKEKISRSGVGSSAGYIPEGNELNTEEIMKILPHRYPFLLVDRIISLDPGKKAVGIKNVTMNEYFFQGHFPGRPVMPGVLITEAMAQVGGVLMLACPEHRGKMAYFMALDKVKFRRTVLPGDKLIIEVEAGKVKTKTGTVYAKAFVDGLRVAEGELMFALVPSN